MAIGSNRSERAILVLVIFVVNFIGWSLKKWIGLRSHFINKLFNTLPLGLLLKEFFGTGQPLLILEFLKPFKVNLRLFDDCKNTFSGQKFSKILIKLRHFIPLGLLVIAESIVAIEIVDLAKEVRQDRVAVLDQNVQ